MVIYIEFKAHEKKHPGKVTPTGKEKYNGVQDFMKFAKERNLSILVTDIGHVYAVGDSIIAHLTGAKQKDIDLIEEKFRQVLHWPLFISGYDPRIELRGVGRFLEHLVDTTAHDLHLKRGRRKKEWGV